MGLLTRIARGARGARGAFPSRAARDFRDEWSIGDYVTMPAMTAVPGALAGGLGGAALNPDDPVAGMSAGALLGAGIAGGAPLAAGLARAAGGFARGFARNLDDMKEEALRYVRGHPPTQQRVMMAQSQDELEQIVQEFVSASRVRGTPGG